ncbi:MAG: RecQ family ATP-dependent DNA helicase [Prolixibacteraceae bacterium]|nr:RecQ family ATP-dependent DNA helicase [Prolixibacteraceae bacterium]
MSVYKNILSRYWGFSSFRPLQEEIIRSVAEGNDTLALMPTGGGKSVTFQVYSLSVEGMCLVVTPLIALMKDQVENLKKRGIKALAIHSGMTREEMNVALDNATWGDFKFLYLSPERIASERFRERLKQMKINLIAVDEAHCISQWGYDFRPSYLRIAELRELLPEKKILALTATATPQVVTDIQEKLHFVKENVLKKSFRRENLIYKVRIEEDKLGYLLRTLKKTTGCGIVYTRSRKKTREIAEALNREGIKAGYYHAGLSSESRHRRQHEWISGKIRIIVATNAFGMGIDKPDVRFVLHADPPDSLEAYFQEAGRAGRDGKKAMAVLLFNNTDTVRLKKGINEKFPPPDTIKKVYDALGNYFQIAVGFGQGLSYDFDLVGFSRKFQLSIAHTHSALKILERDGYLELTDELERPSIIHFRVNRDDLYKFQVANLKFDSFIKLLLRSYTGMFTDYTAINEDLLAKRAKTTREVIYKYLNYLDSHKIIHYIPQKDCPFIVYTRERLESAKLKVSKENYTGRKKIYEEQVGAVIEYATKSSTCRSATLLAYFGDKHSARCGGCDVCEKMNSLGMSNMEFDRISNDIKELLGKMPMLKHELFFKLKGNEENIQTVIKWLLDNLILTERIDKKLEWNGKI